jgi:hypothetical protein
MGVNLRAVIIFSILGLACIAMGLFSKESYLMRGKSIILVKIFGQKGARAFYIILGIILIGAGFFVRM